MKNVVFSYACDRECVYSKTTKVYPTGIGVTETLNWQIELQHRIRFQLVKLVGHSTVNNYSMSIINPTASWSFGKP